MADYDGPVEDPRRKSYPHPDCIPYDEKQAIYRQQSRGSTGGVMAGNKSLDKQESLASVTPRVIQLSQQVAAYSHKIECSFGISSPDVAEKQIPPTAPNLMSQLQEMERTLRSAAYALENALQHING